MLYEKASSLSVNYSFYFYVYRIGLLTNLSFLSFLSYIFLFLHMTDSLLSAFVESNIFFACRSRCRCYTKRLHSLYYRRRSCRTPIENCAERKRKKEKKTKIYRPIIPLHIHILLLTLSFLFFSSLSLSPCYRLVET